MSTPSDIRFQVMWNRLLSVVEEQARALVRTAFSTAAREAGDISAGVFDLDGQMPVSYTHLTLPRSTLCRSRWSPYH